MQYDIESKNLLLKNPAESDAAVYSKLWCNMKVREFLGGVISETAAKDKVTAILEHWRQYNIGQWVVHYKQTNDVLGICGFQFTMDGIELSYMFFPDFWGKGLAKEAAELVLESGFTCYNFDTIIAITQKANFRSCHLLERLGMYLTNNIIRYNEPQCLYRLSKLKWFKYRKKIKKN